MVTVHRAGTLLALTDDLRACGFEPTVAPRPAFAGAAEFWARASDGVTVAVIIADRDTSRAEDRAVRLALTRWAAPASGRELLLFRPCSRGPRRSVRAGRTMALWRHVIAALVWLGRGLGLPAIPALPTARVHRVTGL